MTTSSTSSSPSTQQPVVTVSGPGDLVSLVPYLVGFLPRRSLVVMSLRGERLRCGLTARFDLPDHAADPCDPADPADSADVTAMSAYAEDVARCVERDGPSQVALLVYDDRPWAPDDRPWQHLVDAVEGEFLIAGVPVKEAVYVGADRYWSFTCGSPACCPDEGTRVADVRASTAAASFVLLGRAPLADREELVRRVAPRGPLTTAAVASVADRELGRLQDAEAVGPAAVREWRQRVTRTVDAVVARARAALAAEARQPGERVALGLTADEAGLVAAGLLDVDLRDEVMEGCTAWVQAMPVDRHDDPLVRPCRYDEDPVTTVLLELVTMTDDLLAVAPLTLLTAQLWGAGEGALANAAVERALSIDPDYRLALLLGQVLRAAIPPAWAGGPVPRSLGC